MPTTLIAVSGMSPAIITETLWALANEKPAVIPDEVVIITTTKGKADIQRDLLTPDPNSQKNLWKTLRRDIFKLARIPKKNNKLQLSVRIIDLPNQTTGIREEAADIRTQTHNEEAANFILQTIAPYCDAQDQHVIASIAGGRKTMGALLYASMSLLGKETDRVTHVLVNSPFDTIRNFFYPTQAQQILPCFQEGKPVELQASEAKIELADIPFVPLRNKFEELNERRTFAGLIEAYSRAERPLSTYPKVELNFENATITVLNKTIVLRGRDFLTTAFLYERSVGKNPHYRCAGDAEADFKNYYATFSKRYPMHSALSRWNSPPASEDITKALSNLRQKLQQSGASAAIPYLAPSRSRIGFDIAM